MDYSSHSGLVSSESLAESIIARQRDVPEELFPSQVMLKTSFLYRSCRKRQDVGWLPL